VVEAKNVSSVCASLGQPPPPFQCHFKDGQHIFTVCSCSIVQRRNKNVFLGKCHIYIFMCWPSGTSLENIRDAVNAWRWLKTHTANLIRQTQGGLVRLTWIQNRFSYFFQNELSFCLHQNGAIFKVRSTMLADGFQISPSFVSNDNWWKIFRITRTLISCPNFTGSVHPKYWGTVSYCWVK